MIELKKAVPSDAPLLANTRQKVWNCTYRGIYPDGVIDHFDYAWHTERERKNLSDPAFHTWLVKENGICQGYFTFIVKDMPMWRNYHVRLLSLYLLPSLQGRGLGREILTRVRSQCRQFGFHKLWLSCSPQNTSALGFYTHLGGRIIQERTGHQNPQEDSIEFEFDC